jgi:hypothetical protein
MTLPSCYTSISHALRFTNGGKGLMSHSVFRPNETLRLCMMHEFGNNAAKEVSTCVYKYIYFYVYVCIYMCMYVCVYIYIVFFKHIKKHNKIP